MGVNAILVTTHLMFKVMVAKSGKKQLMLIVLKELYVSQPS